LFLVSASASNEKTDDEDAMLALALQLQNGKAQRTVQSDAGIWSLKKLKIGT
jgi:hypothetical protein